MKSGLILTTITLLATAVHSSVAELEPRATGGYLQNAQGTASFTQHTGCSRPGKQTRSTLHKLKKARAEYSTPAACGRNVTGFSAAMSQLTFGAPPGLGAGDACGRCYQVTANADPFSNYSGPFNTITVKTTNLCAFSTNGTNAEWCSQTQSNPVNQYNMSVQCVFSFSPLCSFGCSTIFFAG